MGFICLVCIICPISSECISVEFGAEDSLMSYPLPRKFYIIAVMGKKYIVVKMGILPCHQSESYKSLMMDIQIFKTLIF